MATKTLVSSKSDAAILSRLIRLDDDDLSVDAARALLRFRFDEDDLARMHELVLKNQDGQLESDDLVERDNYRRVSFMLDLMHSKARRSLAKNQVAFSADGG